MANVAVDYTAIQGMSDKLNAAVADISPQLTSLLSDVNALLQSGGGLFLTQSSPAMTTAYEQFNTSLTSAVQNLSSFAEQFTNISEQLQSMDESIAEGFSSSS